MKNIAVYAGSFDPLTMGHLDVLRRVEPFFQQVHLVVAENINKKYLFSAEERAALIKGAVMEHLPQKSFEVAVHSGLIVDYCRNVGARVLVRGLRAISDFEQELQIATMNRRLDPTIETMHVMTDERFFFVSSTLVKEVARHGGALDELVPANVIEALKERMSQ